MAAVQDEQDIRLRCMVAASAFALLLSLAAPAQSQPPGVSGQISRIGDTTHLEFKGRNEWTYTSPKKIKDKLYFTVPAFDEPTLIQLQNWSCPLVKEIKVNKNAPDGRYEIVMQIAADSVESFDYLTDDPSYLIFDFYTQPKPINDKKKTASRSGPDVKGSKKKNKVAKLPEKIIEGGSEYQKINRAPAGGEILSTEAGIQTANGAINESTNGHIQYERGVFDAGDPKYDRFRVKDYQIKEESIIASRDNIYVRFPALLVKSNRFEELMKVPPVYEIKADESNENKEARLLLSFFEKRKWGSFFETLNYFQGKYPKSKYDEIVRNMAAEARIYLYQKDKSDKDYEAFRSDYKYLIETYPDSILNERHHQILVYSALQKGDGASAIQEVEKYLTKYPNSSEKDWMRMALAEAYTQIHKHEDALKTYREIAADAGEKNHAIEAEFRIGDIFFARKEYQKAIDHYNQIQKLYPTHAGRFPGAQYNKSEALFWMKQYKDSLEGYIDFLSRFPAHQHGGFALTRIGELLEILGADKRKIMGAFIEGYFRYPESQGSEVARIRMLSQGLRGMQEREKKRALAEIEEIATRSTLPQMPEFANLMKAEGLSRRGEHDQSLDVLLKYFQQHPTTANLKVYRSRILRNISDVLKGLNAKSTHIETLNTYGKYSTTWLKNAGRIDTEYFQAVAFEKSGVMKEAEAKYKHLKDQLKLIAGKDEEKERKVYENLPTLDQVNLRLARVALEQKKYRDSFQAIGEIKGQLSPEEEIEKVQIGAAVAERMGEPKRAIEYLEKLLSAQQESVVLTAGPALDLARLYLAENNPLKASAYLSRVEKVKEANADISDELWSRALELRGDIYLKNGEKLAAVEAYTRLLDAYEKKYPLSSIRYKAGRILFDEGDLKGAENLWAGLSTENGELYKKLAQEKLSQAEWQDSYKKYIDRIPAAQDLK